ncbi:MAG: sce7725 family protein [Spirochaetales bacterium]|nr:sce7725 family protein [Spirochaetales bacterium]
MYFPYMRGKQYELLLLKEQAEFLHGKSIFPIIEPVKSNTASLNRTLGALLKSDVKFTLVANPYLGDYSNKENKRIITDFVDGIIATNIGSMKLGIILTPETILDEVQFLLKKYQQYPITLIHSGYPKADHIVDLIENNNIYAHVFMENLNSRIYRKKFTSTPKIIVSDGFVKRPNKEYPEIEHFSELLATYDTEFDGFGDFLIVGSEYSDSGGPAYAVTIHLTYIDRDEENDMFIKHYISDRTNTSDDPAGKFFEALSKLVDDFENGIFEDTSALNEYKRLHNSEHYPGLGYVKKLSMQNHIEIIANHLGG